MGGLTHTVASDIAHQPFGAPRGWTYGNGLTRTQDFDLDGRVLELSTRDGSAFLQKLTYGYDDANRITGLANGVHPTLSQDFTYDPLSRLLSVTASGANQGFAWDATGNRTSHTWAGAMDAYDTSSASNRLGAIHGPRATSFTYDNSGNTLSGEGASFTYNAFGRLATATKSGVTTTYATNALGQRVHKKVGGHWGHYFSYGPGGQLLADADSHGAWNHYVRLPDGTPLAMVRGGQIHYIHTDHLGRPELVTNGAKAAVWRASNHAFDRTVTLDGIGGLNLGFPGQFHDAETGLAYNYFRTYNPRTGRYLESDPIGLAGGLNTYSYVGGNPVNAIDPTGLVAIICAQGNDVQITLPYHFTGSGASASNITSIVNAIQNGLSGQIGDYNVTTTVSLSSSPTPYRENNVTLNAGGGRSNAASWSVPGAWGNYTYMHEAMHTIMGWAYGDDVLHGSILNYKSFPNVPPVQMPGPTMLPQHIQAALNNPSNPKECGCGK